MAFQDNDYVKAPNLQAGNYVQVGDYLKINNLKMQSRPCYGRSSLLSFDYQNKHCEVSLDTPVKFLVII